LLRASLGEDSCGFDPRGGLVVMSTDPITGAEEGIGRLAVHVACNDLAANGARPLGVLVTLLLPPSSDETRVSSVMAEIDQAARELGIEVLGGHTEVTPVVTQVVVSTTSVGLVSRDRLVTSSGARPGDVIVLTKGAGLEGTAILAADFEDVLIPIVGRDCVERARSFAAEISVVREGLLAAGLGVTAMHDVTEGGVLGALFEMASASSVGFVLQLRDIPVRNETVEICRVAKVDPLKLVSSGSMLISCPASRLSHLLRELGSAGILARAVGRFTRGSMIAIDRESGAEIPVGPPEADEIWTARRNLESMRESGRRSESPAKGCAK